MNDVNVLREQPSQTDNIKTCFENNEVTNKGKKQPRKKMAMDERHGKKQILPVTASVEYQSPRRGDRSEVSSNSPRQRLRIKNNGQKLHNSIMKSSPCEHNIMLNEEYHVTDGISPFAEMGSYSDRSVSTRFDRTFRNKSKIPLRTKYIDALNLSTATRTTTGCGKELSRASNFPKEQQSIDDDEPIVWEVPSSMNYICHQQGLSQENEFESERIIIDRSDNSSPGKNLRRNNRYVILCKQCKTNLLSWIQNRKITFLEFKNAFKPNCLRNDGSFDGLNGLKFNNYLEHDECSSNQKSNRMFYNLNGKNSRSRINHMHSLLCSSWNLGATKGRPMSVQRQYFRLAVRASFSIILAYLFITQLSLSIEQPSKLHQISPLSTRTTQNAEFEKQEFQLTSTAYTISSRTCSRATWPSQPATFVKSPILPKKSTTIQVGFQTKEEYSRQNLAKLLIDRRQERKLRTTSFTTRSHKTYTTPLSHQSIQRHSLWEEDLISLSRGLKQKNGIVTIPDEKYTGIYNWTSLCLNADLSTRSRVIITGILTIPAASKFALLIAKQCGVSFIKGIDPILPNKPQLRMKAMETYKQLFRTLQNLELLVPNTSAGYDVEERSDIESRLKVFDLRLENPPRWIHEFGPTHIIHFEPSTFLDFGSYGESLVLDEDDDIRLAHSLERLFRIKQSSLSLEQILRYLLISGPKHRGYKEMATDFRDKHNEKLEQFPRLLYVSSSYTGNGNEEGFSNLISETNALLLEHYYSFTKADEFPQGEKSLSIQQLTYPASYDFGIPKYLNESGSFLDVADAMMIILQAMNHSNGLQRFIVNEKIDVEPTIDGRLVLNNPFYEPRKMSRMNTNSSLYENNTFLFSNDSGQIDDILGIQKSKFPCASSCATQQPGQTIENSCLSSPFDDITKISREATKGCAYVVFMMNFSKSFNDLIQPQPSVTSKSEQLPFCRVAFISGQSRLAAELIIQVLHEFDSNSTFQITQDDVLWKQNGKLTSKGWTVIWLPTHDETMLTDAEISLLYIEPSKFFAATVAKSMYTNVPEFAQPPDESLIRIMNGINRRALPEHIKKEYRSGHQIFRFVRLNAQNARAVIFFAAEPGRKPISLYDYYDGLRLNRSNAHAKPNHRQMSFYEHASYYIESERFRLESEIQNNNNYRKFPYQWISMAVLIHDLSVDEGRSFRCKWYDEHLFWGVPGERSRRPGTEPLSLAYVIGKMKTEGSIGHSIDPQGAWSPFIDVTNNEIIQSQRGADIYIRIMTRDS